MALLKLVMTFTMVPLCPISGLWHASAFYVKIFARRFGTPVTPFRRGIIHYLKYPALAYSVCFLISTWPFIPSCLMAGAQIALWCWLRDADEDDEDRRKRRREKLTAAVRRAGNRLVIVPQPT